jgi:cytochrome b subunit of formate dehydrogenase
MKHYEVRRWVHRNNSTAAMILLTSGTFVAYPDFRTAVLGGHGQLLSDIHFFTGLAFVTAPLLALVWTRGSVTENLKKRLFGSGKVHWRRIHLGVVLFSCCLLAMTGPVMWLDSVQPLPVVLMDVLFLIHTSFAWVVGLALPLHLWMARRSIVRISKQWLGLKKKARRTANLDAGMVETV